MHLGARRPDNKQSETVGGAAFRIPFAAVSGSLYFCDIHFGDFNATRQQSETVGGAAFMIPLAAVSGLCESNICGCQRCTQTIFYPRSCCNSINRPLLHNPLTI